MRIIYVIHFFRKTYFTAIKNFINIMYSCFTNNFLLN